MKTKTKKSCVLLSGLMAVAFCGAYAFSFLNAGAAETSLPSGVDSTGLAAYWAFDDGEGTVATDSSPSLRHMYLNETGTAKWVEGVKGGAFEFDSNSAFLMKAPGLVNKTEADVPYEIGSAYNPDGTEKTDGDSSISVTFALKITEISANTDQGFNTVFSIGNTNGTGALGAGAVQCAIFDTEKSNLTTDIEYDMEREHDWIFAGVNGGGGGLSGNDNIVSTDYIDNDLNQWMHIGLVITDSEDPDIMPSISMYINGQLDKEIELMNTIGLNKAFGYSNEPLCVGGMLESGSLIRGLGGMLDEMTIFTRALSANEVAALAEDCGLLDTSGGDNTGDSGGDNTGDNGNGGATEESGGCGGSIVAAIALPSVAAISAGAVLVRKKSSKSKKSLK